MKLMKKLFWGSKKLGWQQQQYRVQTFEIHQFYINNRLGHFDQFIIAIEMIQILYNRKIDENIV